MIIKIGDRTKKFMEVLEIEEYPFSEKKLKANYRRLSKQHHSDKGGNEEKFKEISIAYNELKNLAINTDSKSAQIIKGEKESDKEDMFKKLYWSKCPLCKGTGKLVRTKYVPGKHDQYYVEKCLHCNGQGETKHEPFNPVIPVGSILR